MVPSILFRRQSFPLLILVQGHQCWQPFPMHYWSEQNNNQKLRDTATPASQGHHTYQKFTEVSVGGGLWRWEATLSNWIRLRWGGGPPYTHGFIPELWGREVTRQRSVYNLPAFFIQKAPIFVTIGRHSNVVYSERSYCLILRFNHNSHVIPP